MDFYITELAKKDKRKKLKDTKFTCPYCTKRDIRENLVAHVEADHKDMIPEGYTAARVVFNSVNRKETSYCVCGCGKEAPWREDIWRYERYATPACKERYMVEMKQRMVNKYGKTHLLDDEEHQQKMLDNRSISGTYKFTTGGSMRYVGSYERNFLHFCDTVMHFKCDDIEQPGPTIPYVYNGAQHFWITDFYIPTFNLVLDIKDGGKHPNQREMPEYRAKQKIKEGTLIVDGKYNYLRLTDNTYPQLMVILAQIKINMMDDGDEPIINIYEFANVPMKKSNLIPLNENLDEDTMISRLIELMIDVDNGYNIFIVVFDDNTIGVGLGKDFIDSRTIIRQYHSGDLSLYNDDMSTVATYKLSSPRNYTKQARSLLEMVSGIHITESSQLEFDPRFEKISPKEDLEKMQLSCMEATLLKKKSISIMTEIAMVNKDIMSGIDEDGIFIENTYTGLRSPSYKDESIISKDMINIINKGIL